VAKKTVQRQTVVGAVTIRIQPFEDMPAAYTQYVVGQLQKLYSKMQVLLPIKFPPRAMNAAGTRYKAHSLIRFLHHTTPAGSLSMGLSLKEICTNKYGNPDWGIFGLG
jgi:archaemetzincin